MPTHDGVHPGGDGTRRPGDVAGLNKRERPIVERGIIARSVSELSAKNLREVPEFLDSPMRRDLA